MHSEDLCVNQTKADEWRIGMHTADKEETKQLYTVARGNIQGFICVAIVKIIYRHIHFLDKTAFESREGRFKHYSTGAKKHRYDSESARLNHSILKPVRRNQ